MFSPGYDGFLEFAATVGLDLEPFQEEIARCVFEGPRELLVLLPRGNGKTTLLAAICLHHLLTVDEPEVWCGAANREQAAILLEAAKRLAKRLPPSVRVQVLKMEIRRDDRTGAMRLLAGQGSKAQGKVPTFCVLDEMHAHKDDSLYTAMAGAMHKDGGKMRLVTISTADVGEDRPLSQLRAKALRLPKVERIDNHLVCEGRSLKALLWEIEDGVNADDLDAILAVNPFSQVTAELLEEQRERLPDISYLRYCANGRLAAGSWLPPGAWHECIGSTEFEEGEDIWIGCDVGGTEAATAVVWMNEAGHVGAWIETAEDAILNAGAKVRELRSKFRVVEFAYDKWHCEQLGLELEREGMRCVKIGQEVHMIPASSALRLAITEGRLTLPDHPDLNRHAANATAKHTPRGWKIASPARGVQVDGIVALAMANMRREFEPEPARVLAVF